LQEAEAAYREAIRLKPDYAEAYCNLGQLLQGQGRFAEALESLRRGHDLGGKSPGWRSPSADWARQCERFVELDRMLPAVLRGEARPATAAEGLELASLCQLPCKRLHAAAARLAADAFAADPKLADDLRQQPRYNAACSAALAAAGQAEDAKRLPDRGALALRRQALDWLRADLAAWAKVVEKAPQARSDVQRTLRHWQQDPDLAGLRDQDALAKLPEPERDACRRLWAEVDALLRRARREPDEP
jgi:serine/threonine-protein kinase